MYIVFQKNYRGLPFYFCDNFVGDEPILIIFGKNVAKEIGNTQSLIQLVLFAHLQLDSRID